MKKCKYTILKKGTDYNKGDKVELSKATAEIFEKLELIKIEKDDFKEEKNDK